MIANEDLSPGQYPLQTIQIDIDYGFAEASTSYGRVDCTVCRSSPVKVLNCAAFENQARKARAPRPPSNDRRNGDRRGNGERRPYNNDRRSYNGERPSSRNNNNTEGGNPLMLMPKEPSTYRVQRAA